MGVFLATIDGSIVNISLPTLVSSFQTDFALVQWVVLSYLLTVTTLMLGVGRLADIYGKKPIYTAGFIVFTVGSVLCGLSPTIYTLIGFRIVQGVGAAMIMALGMAIVTEAFPGSERGRALGITGTIVSVGIAVGPTLGGLIVQNLSWHWIFFVNLPIGIIGTWMVIRYVPAFKPPGGQRFDYWGALTLCISLLSLLVALTLGQRVGFGDRTVLLLAGMFDRLPGNLHPHRTAHGAADARPAPVPQQPVLGLADDRLHHLHLPVRDADPDAVLHPERAGLRPATDRAADGYGAGRAGDHRADLRESLSDRFGSRPITVAGLAMLTVGFLAVSSLDAETTTLGYVLRFLPVGLGVGMFQSPNNSAIMGAAPRDRLGIASGMLAVTRTLGQTTGIAVLGALWAGQVFKHAGEVLAGGATAAPIAAQVFALRDTFVIVSILIFAALLLSIWGLREERKQKRYRVLRKYPN